MPIDVRWLCDGDSHRSGWRPLLTIIAGCDDNGPGDTVEADLEAARSSWADSGVSEYQLVVTSGPNQLSSAGCEWTAVVENGVVASAAAAPELHCGDEEWSVGRLHDLVADLQAEVREFEAPEFGEHTLDVDHDATGVPVAIEFDLANGDDEELSLQVELSPRS